MDLSNHLPGFNVNAEVIEFDFNVEKQTITVVWKMPFNPSLMVYCPDGCPDTVWKEVYGIEDGKLTLLRTIQGHYVPAYSVPESYKFEDDGI